MKKNYLKFKSLLVLALFVSVAAHSQLTYTFAYTGAVQTLTLPPGFWGIQCWAADGGSITSAGGGGKGGYSYGVYNVVVNGTQLNIYVGGKGNPATGTSSSAGAGGWNGGGGGSAIGRSGAGGGGATDVRVGGVAAANRIIVAGGGGGAAYYGSSLTQASVAAGGHGGAVLAQNGNVISSAGVITLGGGGTGANGGTPGTGGGTNTGGGGGGYGAGGGSVGQAGTGGGSGGQQGSSGSGSTGSAGGGGGGFAGGGGGVQTGNQGAAGGGGSGFIGGVTSGTTAMFGQTVYVVNPDVTGNGRVIITELCNISLMPSTSNTINPSICNGQSVTFTTNAVSNFSWSTGATTSSITVSPSVTTVYTLTATSASNCIATRIMTITVSGGLPNLSVTSSTNQACLGQTTTLTASGALTYTWSGNVTNGVGFAPTATNSYTVTGQNGCGTATAVTSISVAPLAVSIVANPTLVCAGSTSTLNTASAGTSFTWTPLSNNSASIVVSPIVNTIYTVVASDGTCAGVATVAVNTLPVPTVAISPTLTTLCSGLPVNLTASGAISYTWSVGNQTGSAITVTPNAPTGYQVIGSNSVGCTSVANAVIVTLSSPTISIVANNYLVCSGDQVDITASGASSYTWDNSSINNSITVNPTVTSVYTVTGTTSGCSTTETVSISVFAPTLAITGNTSICSGQSSTIIATGGNTYLWNNGFTNASILVTPASTSIYSVTALTNSSGVNCPSSGSIQVVVKPNPTITATASRTNMCRSENNNLSVTGANSYSWSNGATTASFAITPTLVTTITYSVIGTGLNACTNTTSIQVKVNSCTGVEEMLLGQSKLMIYPNPSNGNFKVKGDSEIELQLINEIGQLIQVININEANQYEFNINNLKSGIYFIYGNQSGNILMQKVIVTN